MTGEKFYQLCDAVEELPFNITNGYFPTKEEVEYHLQTGDPDEQIPMLLFFATDPLKKYDLSSSDRKDYEELVKFAKDYTLHIQLED